MMNFPRFPSSTNHNSKSLLYTESEHAVEPTQEDIEEYGRRIGIDTQTEPHLMQLARQGLMAKLPPDWKPCKEPHRDVWFYYNNKTHVSQWDHPMDEIYKEKVVQARQDHAMNRIQSFDLNAAPKPLKSLPPLKKSGGGLSPISFPSTLSKLGPLRNSSFSSSDDLSQFSSSQKQGGGLGLLQPLDPLKKSQSMTLNGNNNNSSILNNNLLNGNHNSSNALNSISNGKLNGNADGEKEPLKRIKMDAQSQSVSAATIPAPVKKAGLTLTGSGASFLKSAKSSDGPEKPENVEGPTDKFENGLMKGSGPDLRINDVLEEDSSKFFQAQVSDNAASPSPVGGHTSSNNNSHSSNGNESSGSESGGRPLKGILQKSAKSRFRGDECTTRPPRTNLWEISPKEMTDEEYELWNSLDYKRKTSVKFNLDDPTLVFEFNRDESDNPNDSEENDNSETEEDTEDHEAPEEEGDNQSISKSSNDNELSKSVAESFAEAGDCFLSPSNEHLLKGKERLPLSQRLYPKGNSSSSSKSAPAPSTQKNVIEQEKEPVLDRATMKANVDKHIKEFQAKLEEEQKSQEKELKANMEETISFLKVDMESTIAKTKLEFESYKKSEIVKARKDMETKLLKDVETLRDEYKSKLSQKRKEFEVDHSKELDNLGREREEKLMRIKTDPRLVEVGKEYEKELEIEIKSLKQTMEQQHKKQVEEMKALHSSTIQKMKTEFQTEKEKLKKEHADIIAEMLSKFDSEKHNLLRSFEVEQDKIKQEFSMKATALTSELTGQIETVRKDFEEKKQMLAQNMTTELDREEESRRSEALRRAEEELAHLRSKYIALEEKYSNLKKGVQSVVKGEERREENLQRSDSFVIDVIEPHPNDTDSGAAESDTSYSMSISAPGGIFKEPPKRDVRLSQEVCLQKLVSGSNDRLNQALRALDELKQQIMDIKAEQSEKDKMLSLNDKLEQEQQFGQAEEIQVLHVRNKGSKFANVQTATLPLSSSQIRLARARPSRSTIGAVGTTRAASTKDLTDGSHYVDEAKDFIKTQKHRLKKSGLTFGQPSSSAILSARQRAEYKMNSINSNQSSESLDRSHNLNPYKSLRNHNQSVDHHSETESSGVGSLKESSAEKSKISRDIEGILSSLQQLDGQMKYLWSVVGSTSGVANQAPPPPLASSSPLQISRPQPFEPDRAASRPQIETTIIGSRDGQNNFSDLAMKYNLTPNLITPGNQALINSINAVNSIPFRRSFESPSNSTVITNPALVTLEEHVNNIRNRQSRILKQYPRSGADIPSRERDTSISERTKDLREWLEKF